MRLPDGVVGLRKVKTVLGGEDGRVHLTWVLAYNAGIEIGSERYEAIRAFAGGLKAPQRAGKPMEHDVMFLPVAAPDTSQAPQPAARTAPRRKRRAAPAKKRRPQPAAKRVAKSAAKRAARTTLKPAAKSRPGSPHSRSRRPSRPRAR